MAQARIDIVVNDSSLESLEAQLQQLNQRLKQVGVNSAEFKALSAQIRSVQTNIDNANKSLRGFDIGAAVGNASKILGGLAAGVAGISALFVDAEDSAEELAQTQQRLAAAFGLVQAGEALATIATLTNTQAVAANTLATQTKLEASLRQVAAASSGAAAESALTSALIANGIAFELAAQSGLGYDLVINGAQLEIKKLNGQIIFTNVATQEQVLVFTEATGAITTYNGAVLASTKSTGFLATAFKTLGATLKAALLNPITILIAVLTALYFAVETLRDGFREFQVVSEYGAAIEDLSSIVDSSIGSFNSLTGKIIQYQTATRLGILSDKERAQVQKQLAEELTKFGFSQEEVNATLRDGTVAVEEYLKVLPKLIQQQVIFQAISKEYEKLLALELDPSRAEPSFIQSLGNAVLSLGNNFTFTLRQIRTQSDNLSEETEQSLTNIEKLLQKYEESVKDTPGLVKQGLLGNEKEQKETVQQVRDITNEINALIRADREENLRKTKTDYDLERALLDEKLKNDIEDAKMANKEIQDDDKISASQKAEFAKATDAEILRLTSEFVREKKKLNDEEAKDYIENLESIYDEHQDLYQAYLDRETGRIETVSRLEEAALTKRFLEGEISERKFQEAIFDSRQKALEKEEEARTRTILDKRRLVQDELRQLEGQTGEAAEQRRKELLNEEDQLNKDLIDVQKEYLAEYEDLQNERVDFAKQKRAEQFSEFVQAVSDIAIGSLEIYNDFLQSQIDLLGIQTQSQLDELDERIAAGQEQFAVRQKQLESSTLLSAKARANAIAQLEEQRLAEEKKQAAERERIEKEAARQGLEIQGKQNKASLAIAIAQAIAQAASGIATATAQAPLTFGASLALIAPIAVSLAAAIGAFKAQGNVIDAQTKALGFAEGGFVSGPGSGTSDSIPARLSNGEFVVNAASTAQNLPLLEAINSTTGEGSGITSVLNELRSEIKSLRERPVKAYVVTSELDEVTKTQDYINRRASL